MLSAKQVNTGQSPPYFDVAFDDVRLTVLCLAPGAPKQIPQSQELHELSGGTANALQLYVLDEAPPKVIVEAVMIGAGWTPSNVAAFAWAHTKLVDVLSVFSNEPVWVQDLDGDGQREIGGVRLIGLGVAISDMPRWPDIYAYEGGEYVLDSRRFPRAFGEAGRQIQYQVGRHPNDFELLKYLGIYYEIAGDRSKALNAYQRAATMLEASEYLPRDLKVWERADISTRIRQLTR